MSELISIVGLEREMEESLLCRECYPSCSENKYRVTTSSLPLVVNNRSGFGITQVHRHEILSDVLPQLSTGMDCMMCLTCRWFEFSSVSARHGSTNKTSHSTGLKYSVSNYRRISLNNLFIDSTGNIGGLCGIVGGFSLISFTEISYFIIKQTLLFIMRKLNIKFRSNTLEIYPWTSFFKSQFIFVTIYLQSGQGPPQNIIRLLKKAMLRVLKPPFSVKAFSISVKHRR